MLEFEHGGGDVEFPPHRFGDAQELVRKVTFNHREKTAHGLVGHQDNPLCCAGTLAPA
jgi:hypothetical protein